MDWQRDTFEALYLGVGDDLEAVPWAKLAPTAPFVAWLDREWPHGHDERALVIGCGLGDDAEELDGRGFDVSAFDISDTAIEWCRRRFPDTRVDYRAADLLDLPAEWSRAFGLVVEIITIQSLPLELRERAVAAIGDAVAPGGTLYVWCLGRGDGEPVGGRPWPVSRADMRGFEAGGLTPTGFREVDVEGWPRFEAMYRR
jgi:SAM-dependent methyltransferase